MFSSLSFSRVPAYLSNQNTPAQLIGTTHLMHDKSGMSIYLTVMGNFHRIPNSLSKTV